MKGLGLSIVVGLLAPQAVAHPVQSQNIAQLRVQSEYVVCVDFVTGDGSCASESHLSLINTDKAYYHYTLPQASNPIEVYFFYAGVYKLKFKCRFASSNDKNKEGKPSREIDKVIYLQGGQQYLAAQILPFGAKNPGCKVKIQELNVPN